MLLAAVLLVLRSAAAGDQITKKRALARTVLARTAAIVLLVLVFCGANAAIGAYASDAHIYGIVVAADEMAKSGPGPEFAEVFELHSGTKVRIRAEHQKWYQVSLESGLSGWLPSEAVEII